MDFYDMFGIAVIMGMRDYYRDIDRQKKKTAQFYQKCIEEIADEMAAAFKLISDEAMRANPNYFPDEIGLGGIYLGLYGCGLVLQDQPAVSAEQDKLLDLMFRSLPFKFSKAQFLSAMRTKGGIYQQFIDVVGITKSKAGSFWVAFFRTLYKNGMNQDLLTSLMQHFSNVVMRFAILGHPNSQVALPIVECAYKAVDAQLIACCKTVDDEVDIIGIKSYQEHYRNMKSLFDGLLYDSNPEEDDVEPETFLQLFEYMLLNNITDLVMACNRGRERKIRMIDEVLENIPYGFSMDANTFLSMKANNKDFRALINNMIVTTSQKLGKFWFFILVFGEKTSRQEDCLAIAKAYMGMMCGIEADLAKRYPQAGFSRIARDQAMPIIAGMAREYE